MNKFGVMVLAGVFVVVLLLAGVVGFAIGTQEGAHSSDLAGNRLGAHTPGEGAASSGGGG